MRWRPITQRVASARSSERRRAHMPLRVGPRTADDAVHGGRRPGTVIEHGLQITLDCAHAACADVCVVR